MRSVANEKAPGTRQNEIKRITSNLPEVYNRYFFTNGEQDRHAKMNETSPAKLGGKKNAFSLNRTQKDSIRQVGESSEMQMLANQTAKHSLKHYANKNVFQKTLHGSFKRKVAVEEEKSVEDVSVDVGRKNFASLASSHGDMEDEFEIKQDRGGSKVIHVTAEIDQMGRRTHQKMVTNSGGEDKKELDGRHFTAMAKTYDDGKWAKDFEVNEDDFSDDDKPIAGAESFHTLKRRGSDGVAGSQAEVLDIMPDPGQETLKKAELPEKFRNTTLTGFKNAMGPTSEAPSCFCEKQGVCQKHGKFEPTVESMIEILEEQVQALNKDETSMEQNLDFLGKSMDAILLSRRDTFKE